jgi:type II secretory pathway pseudopilin PulG
MRQAHAQPTISSASSESGTQTTTTTPPTSGERGFTMLVTLVVLFIASLLMAGAWAAANGDIHLTQTDSNAKKAYYAAQAGISAYIYHLNQDINYWTYCTEGAAASNHALNQEGSTVNRVAVPGASEEQYAIQLLHASTAPVTDLKCDPAKPVATMIEGGTAFGGTFRIESTGYSGNQERTIVATFGHKGFLEFIYYTKYETLDPVTYTPVEPKCEAPYKTRPEPPCARIDFITADHINGPFHTQDNASICGEPTFGRKSSDNIEFLHGWRESCGGKPKFLGTEVTKNLKSIEPPPSDVTLRNVVEPAYHYTGKTTIVLEGEKMKVTYFEKVGEVLKEITKENVALPTNGLIYVSNNGSCGTYTPYGPTYTTDTSCGNVYVKGNYTGQLTIASENDVVINGSITTPINAEGIPSTNAVLGLIADNFVRIYHPLTGARPKEFGECGSTSNAEGTMKNVSVYAAILAVNHSFIVDNFDCGSPMEKLSVYGAIAQIFRGTVGTHSGGAVVSGYAKNYNYDDRLTVESPPDFLSPVAAAWIVKRETLAPNP